MFWKVFIEDQESGTELHVASFLRLIDAQKYLATCVFRPWNGHIQNMRRRVCRKCSIEYVGCHCKQFSQQPLPLGRLPR